MWGWGAGSHPPCRNSPAETLEINRFFLTGSPGRRRGICMLSHGSKIKRRKMPDPGYSKKTGEQAGLQVKELRGVTKIGKGCEE